MVSYTEPQREATSCESLETGHSQDGLGFGRFEQAVRPKHTRIALSVLKDRDPLQMKSGKSRCAQFDGLLRPSYLPVKERCALPFRTYSL